MPANDFLKYMIKFFPTISKFLGINRDAVVCLFKCVSSQYLFDKRKRENNYKSRK